jgi:hypothetical protein
MTPEGDKSSWWPLILFVAIIIGVFVMGYYKQQSDKIASRDWFNRATQQQDYQLHPVTPTSERQRPKQYMIYGPKGGPQFIQEIP